MELHIARYRRRFEEIQGNDSSGVAEGVVEKDSQSGMGVGVGQGGVGVGMGAGMGVGQGGQGQQGQGLGLGMGAGMGMGGMGHRDFGASQSLLGHQPQQQPQPQMAQMPQPNGSAIPTMPQGPGMPAPVTQPHTNAGMPGGFRGS